jgi:hypothetical protein
MNTLFDRQPMKTRLLTASALVLSAASPLLEAAPQLPPEAEITGACLTLNDTGDAAAAIDMAVARLGGRYEADILSLLENGDLKYSYQPARWRDQITIATGRAALAAYHTPSAPRDIVVTTGPGGLLQHHYSLSGGATTTLLDSGWEGVTDLEVDRNGVLLGLNPQSTKVYRIDLSTMENLEALTIPLGVVQIAPMDWDADGSEDLVARSASSLSVFRQSDDSLLWSSAAAGLADRIVVARAADGEFDDILARTLYLPGMGCFLQHLNAGDQNDPWIFAGPDPVTALTSGDVAYVGSPLTASADNDLIVCTSNSEVLVFQRGTVYGDSQGYLLFPNLFDNYGQGFYSFEQLGTTEGVLASALAIGDLDVDGDVDIAFRGMAETDSVLGWQLNNRYLRENSLPHSSNLVISQVNGNYSGDITWTGAAPAGATHIQASVLVHKAGYVSLYSSPIPQGGLNSLLIPLNNQTYVHTGVLNLATGEANPVWNIIYRSVQLDTSNNIIKAWPTLTYLSKAPGSNINLNSWPEVYQATLETNLYKGAGTHSGGTQGGGGRGEPPPPILP